MPHREANEYEYQLSNAKVKVKPRRTLPPTASMAFYDY
jgi:hypothetical protein